MAIIWVLMQTFPSKWLWKKNILTNGLLCNGSTGSYKVINLLWTSKSHMRLLLVISANCGRTSHRLGHAQVKDENCIFWIHPLFDTHIEHSFMNTAHIAEKYSSWRLQDPGICWDTVPACDRQTDRQIDSTQNSQVWQMNKQTGWMATRCTAIVQFSMVIKQCVCVCVCVLFS